MPLYSVLCKNPGAAEGSPLGSPQRRETWERPCFRVGKPGSWVGAGSQVPERNN